jgi:hypothetical protein
MQLIFWEWVALPDANLIPPKLQNKQMNSLSKPLKNGEE